MESATGPAADFANLATAVGANPDQYQACIDGGEKEAIVQQRVNDAVAKRALAAPPVLN